LSLSSRLSILLLTRISVCRVKIAKPPRPCSTRSTCPTASTRALDSVPGSTGRNTLKPICVPGGGHVLAKNECSTLAHVTSVALTLFINSSVCPPEHDRCLQGEPYGLSGVFLRFHPLPQLEAVNSSSKIHRESYARPRVSTRCEMSFNWKPFVCRG